MSNLDIFAQIAERLASDVRILREIEKEALVTAVGGDPNLISRAIVIAQRWQPFTKQPVSQFTLDNLSGDVSWYLQNVVPKVYRLVSSWCEAYAGLRSSFPDATDLATLVFSGQTSLNPADVPLATTIQLALDQINLIWPTLEAKQTDDSDLERATRAFDEEFYQLAKVLNPSLPLSEVFNGSARAKAFENAIVFAKSKDDSRAYAAANFSEVLAVVRAPISVNYRATIPIAAAINAGAMVLRKYNIAGVAYGAVVLATTYDAGTLRVYDFYTDVVPAVGEAYCTLRISYEAGDPLAQVAIGGAGTASVGLTFLGAGSLSTARTAALPLFSAITGQQLRGTLFDAIADLPAGALDAAYSGISGMILSACRDKELASTSALKPLSKRLEAAARAAGAPDAAALAVRNAPVSQWFQLDNWCHLLFAANGMLVEHQRAMYQAFYNYLVDFANTASINPVVRAHISNIIST
jgi:hypothetical protein